jgi:hypothetical protein
MNIRYLRAFQARIRHWLAQCVSSNNTLSSSANDQPTISLSPWDAISLREDIRDLGRIAANIDAILKKSAF